MAQSQTLDDAGETFEVLRFEAPSPRRTALFSVGLGGDPDRHAPLLRFLAEGGCTVIAPRFERLASPVPTGAELLSRARKLRAAAAMADPDRPLAGIGHSIGAMLLVALAGGRPQTLAGETLDLGPKLAFDRLLLLAPATDFFRAPTALDLVTTPLAVWAGGKDTVTPPAQAAFLGEALGGRATVDLRTVPEAGHFTFMNTLPPGVVDTHPDREAFLRQLAADVRTLL